MTQQVTDESGKINLNSFEKFEVQEAMSEIVIKMKSDEILKFTITYEPGNENNIQIDQANVVTEHELMTDNFVYDENFQEHKYYKKNIVLNKLVQKEGESTEDYEERVRRMVNLFRLYRYAILCPNSGNSTFCHFHDYRGNLHEIDGDYDKAQSDYELAIKGEAALDYGYLGLARVLLITGRTEEALKQFNEAVYISEEYGSDREHGYERVRESIKTVLDRKLSIKSQSRVKNGCSI